MLKFVALAALALPLGVSGTALGAAPLDKIVPGEGDPAPYFEGKWMQHEKTTLAQLEGRLVFIEFWRTW